MIVVAIIGILIAIAVPAFLRARENARGRACQENLTKLEGAKMLFALETKAQSGDEMPEDAIYNSEGTGYLRLRPDCPADGSDYEVGLIGELPTCPNYDPESPYVKHTIPGIIPDSPE